MAIISFIAIAVFLCKQSQLLHPFHETISNPSSCRSSDSRLRHLLEVSAPAFCLLGFPMTGFRQRITGSAHTAAVPSRIRTWFPCPFILLLPQYDHNKFLFYFVRFKVYTIFHLMSMQFKTPEIPVRQAFIFPIYHQMHRHPHLDRHHSH